MRRTRLDQVLRTEGSSHAKELGLIVRSYLWGVGERRIKRRKGKEENRKKRDSCLPDCSFQPLSYFTSSFDCQTSRMSPLYWDLCKRMLKYFLGLGWSCNLRTKCFIIHKLYKERLYIREVSFFKPRGDSNRQLKNQSGDSALSYLEDFLKGCLQVNGHG